MKNIITIFSLLLSLNIFSQDKEFKFFEWDKEDILKEYYYKEYDVVESKDNYILFQYADSIFDYIGYGFIDKKCEYIDIYINKKYKKQIKNMLNKDCVSKLRNKYWIFKTESIELIKFDRHLFILKLIKS